LQFTLKTDKYLNAQKTGKVSFLIKIDLSSLVRLKDTKCPKLRISGVVTCPPTERQELCPKHLHDANRGQEASGAVPFSVSILHSVAWGGGEKGA
jgi:hypothetical protein